MPQFPAVSAAATTFSSLMTLSMARVTSSTVELYGPSYLQLRNNEPQVQTHGNSKPQTEAKYHVTALQTAQSVFRIENSMLSHSSSLMSANLYLGPISWPTSTSRQTIATKSSSISPTARNSQSVALEIPNTIESTISTKPTKRETRSTTFSTAFRPSPLRRSLHPKCPTELNTTSPPTADRSNQRSESSTRKNWPSPSKNLRS